MVKRDSSKQSNQEENKSLAQGLDEFELIKHLSDDFVNYRQHLVSNGDDAAIFLPEKNKGQIVCVDTMVEEIHFKRITMSPFHIGYKSLAVNLSDIAAMGGEPHSFLVSIAIPPSWSPAELKEIYRGMKELADRYRIDLLGGDTVATEEKLVISVTVIGHVEENIKLIRANAKPGDLVFVTGTLGDSAAGLNILLQYNEQIQPFSKEGEAAKKDDPYDNLIRAHQLPHPHIQQGRILAQYAQQASISLNDVSDGLASELSEIALSSGVNIVINMSAVPLSEALTSYTKEHEANPYSYALYGGEDFILAGTIPPQLQEKVTSAFKTHSLPFTVIGYVENGPGEVWVAEQGSKTKLKEKGYNHFN